MKGTLVNFVKRLEIESKYPNYRFNHLRKLLIKDQIKGAINNVAGKAGKLLEQIQ